MERPVERLRRFLHVSDGPAGPFRKRRSPFRSHRSGAVDKQRNAPERPPPSERNGHPRRTRTGPAFHDGTGSTDHPRPLRLPHVPSDPQPVSSPFEDDDGDDPTFHGQVRGPWPPAASEPEQLTLALLEDLAAVLMRHGYPPLRGYALAELAGSLYRIGQHHP